MKKLLILTLISFFLITTSCGSSKSISETDRDGSSYEMAIIVNSVPEEYAYIRKVCQGCQVVSQALTYSKGKPYDILKVNQPDGKMVSYYFDISKFFGKGF